MIFLLLENARSYSHFRAFVLAFLSAWNISPADLLMTFSCPSGLSSNVICLKKNFEQAPYLPPTTIASPHCPISIKIFLFKLGLVAQAGSPNYSPGYCRRIESLRPAGEFFIIFLLILWDYHTMYCVYIHPHFFPGSLLLLYLHNFMSLFFFLKIDSSLLQYMSTTVSPPSAPPIFPSPTLSLRSTPYPFPFKKEETSKKQQSNTVK